MNKYTIMEIVSMGMMTAILFAAQVLMGFLPNIEIVSLLIVLYAMVYGKKVFFIIYTFVLLEGLFYGFGLWWINYTYVWTVLAIIALIFRKNTSSLFWSIITGFYGLFYGALCAIIYLFIGGPSMAVSYWISGLPFDLTHCIGNFVVCIALFNPLYRILTKCNGFYCQKNPC